MHLEEFAFGSSFLHRIDPRVKIIVAALFSMIIALADRPGVLALGLGSSILAAALAELDWWRLLSRLAIVNLFIIFLWLFLPFTQAGRTFYKLGGLTVTYEGLGLALAITVKSNAIVLAGLALLSTSPFIHLVHALRHLYLPDKLVHLFFFTFRYFQVIHGEYLRLRTAMRIRCFQPRTNLHTYRSLAYLVGMLLVKSYDRSQRVYQAMLCRGYQGRFWVLDHFHLHNRDLVFLGLTIIFIIALAVGQWTNLAL